MMFDEPPNAVSRPRRLTYWVTAARPRTWILYVVADVVAGLSTYANGAVQMRELSDAGLKAMPLYVEPLVPEPITVEPRTS